VNEPSSVEATAYNAAGMHAHSITEKDSDVLPV